MTGWAKWSRWFGRICFVFLTHPRMLLERVQSGASMTTLLRSGMRFWPTPSPTPDRELGIHNENIERFVVRDAAFQGHIIMPPPVGCCDVTCLLPGRLYPDLLSLSSLFIYPLFWVFSFSFSHSDFPSLVHYSPFVLFCQVRFSSPASLHSLLRPTLRN